MGEAAALANLEHGKQARDIYIYIYHQTFLSKDLISEPISGYEFLTSSREGAQFQKMTLAKTMPSADHVS